MEKTGRQAGFWLSIVASFWIASCGGGGSTTPPPTTTYVLTVNSANPASGVTITATPADNNGATNGTTSFTRTYNAGTSVTLTAPATPGGNTFSSWTGCAPTSAVTCTVTLNANTTVTANYAVPVTYFLTVNSTNPASGVAITATPSDNNGATNGATSFTRTYNAGTSVTLTAPATSGGNTFASWTGCTSTSTVTCTVTLNANTTVTANYTAAKITPSVAVTPSASSITTAQELTVTVAVNGGSGNPTPTGAVALNSGTYTSAAATLSSGSASMVIPAGSLATGTDTLTVSYTPDTASSSIYNSASGAGSVTVTAPATYALTVDSAAPSSGISITVTPQDNNGAGTGTTPFTRTYNSGTQVTLSAALSVNGYSFVSWTGCTNASSSNCDVTMSANTTVTATYNQAASVTSIAVTPTTATIGTQQQFAATVNGTGAYSSGVTWTLTCSSCGNLSPGTLSSTGLYTTPYPAPASVTVTATSTMTGYTNVSGSATVTLGPPATATGPALSVNVGTPGNPISPDIYGMDAYLLDATAADTAAVAKTNITVDRWGGDSTERYNYQLDVTNSIDDWYFENGTGNGGDGWPVVSGVKAFDALVESNNSNGIKTLGTVPVIGWVAKDSTSCSYPQSTYPDQLAVNNKPAFSTDGRECGSGIYPQGVSGCTNSGGCNIPSDPTVTSISAPPPAPPAPSAATTSWAQNTWTGGWVNYLVNKFGPGNPSAGVSTGVSIYDLDNEPTWWYSNDADVHPLPFTYDEVTNGGIGTALAIKTVDPTAQVSGPVIDYWWAYFYSMKDITSGWSSGSCYRPWSNPIDREAHGGVPLIEYYLQQFAAAQTTYGIRLLDYVDMHTYFAAQYPANSGAGLGLNSAGDTGAQQARLNSTRAFWDPTYTDSSNSNGNGFPQPNYPTDPNYTGATNCNPPQQAPQLIRMMKTWVANYYPGTKTAIDEYNFGGMEAINGALTQADILGIFAREGLDLGTMWPTTDPSQQIPGMMALAIYRNYDGNKSTFGDTVLPSTSTNQGTLSVYGAIHTAGASNGTVTVVVINKTYGPLTSTLSLANLPSTATTAKAYLYSNANLTAIVAQPAVTVTPPATGGTTSTIADYTFPAQSITLFVVPN